MGGPRRGLFSLFATAGLAAVFLCAAPATANADLSRKSVEGHEVDAVELEGRGSPKQFASLRALAAEPWHRGVYAISFRTSAAAVELPWCAGRTNVFVDEAPKTAPLGPFLLELGPGEHKVRFQVEASTYEHRIACGGPIVAGVVTTTRVGLQSLRFESPVKQAGGGTAFVFIPSDENRLPNERFPLLVGVHPWNGSIATYAAYRSLLEEAERQRVALLFPSGLGNSLYTAAAEEEVMRAIDAAARELPIDASRVSIWGASMGGAGATTIGFHRPDRFATITSFFGDASYHLDTYVKAILRDEAGAHQVNPIDVADNARHVPVWLIHGTADTVSPVKESDELHLALKKRGYSVRYDRVEDRGHEGSLVELYLRHVVALAKISVIPSRPTHVSYRSVRASDRGAYGVTIEPRGKGDALIDIAYRENSVHVARASNVAKVALAKGALGAPSGAPIVHEDPSGARPTVSFAP